MAHYLLLCEFTQPGDEEKIKKWYLNREYAKNKMQIREVKLLDFALRESREDEFLTDVANTNYMEFKSGNFRRKLLDRILYVVNKVFNLEKIDMSDYENKSKEPRIPTHSKFLLLGKLTDKRVKKNGKIAECL